LSRDNIRQIMTHVIVKYSVVHSVEALYLIVLNRPGERII